MDKDSGAKSRRAGNQIRKMSGAESFGHIGTLDPMASGVLPIALGEATKMIPYMPGGRKVYEFSIVFGIKTDTDDIMGNILMRSPVKPGTTGIKKALEGFHGKIMQVPPAYSAVHVDGVRAYKLARKGQAVDIPAREVEVFALSLLDDGMPGQARHDNEYRFRVECSAGTYVRALARDIAAKLGTFGVAGMIRRVETNGFSLKDAIRLEKLEELVNNGRDESFNDSNPGGEFGEGILKPVDFGLDGIPVLNLDSEQTRLFRNGGFVALNAGNCEGTSIFRIYYGDEFIGIGMTEGGLLRPKRVINK